MGGIRDSALDVFNMFRTPDCYLVGSPTITTTSGCVSPALSDWSLVDETANLSICSPDIQEPKESSPSIPKEPTGFDISSLLRQYEKSLFSPFPTPLLATKTVFIQVEGRQITVIDGDSSTTYTSIDRSYSLRMPRVGPFFVEFSDCQVEMSEENGMMEHIPVTLFLAYNNKLELDKLMTTLNYFGYINKTYSTSIPCPNDLMYFPFTQ